jgi:NADPH-dependent ferric siderophore reductase
MNDLENAQITRSSLDLVAEIETAVLKLTLRQVDVKGVEVVGDRFRLITVAGASLVGRRWTPGEMIQVAFPGWQSRAYTPFAFDPAHGTAQFLGYIHGNGKGIASAWLESAYVGQERFIFGPRRAINLTELQRPALLFGDETSISTAAALMATPRRASDAHAVFEVTSIEQSRAALERLGLDTCSTLIQREENDAHFKRLEAVVLAAFQSNSATRGILTGDAASIRRVYKALRRDGVPSKQLTNLAYWAPGRKGFSGVQR